MRMRRTASLLATSATFALFAAVGSTGTASAAIYPSAYGCKPGHVCLYYSDLSSPSFSTEGNWSGRKSSTRIVNNGTQQAGVDHIRFTAEKYSPTTGRVHKAKGCLHYATPNGSGGQYKVELKPTNSYGYTVTSLKWGPECKPGEEALEGA
ncbi:hypothetical protein GCM10009837_75340 [Streptomyces durmitorensis]|uniref:Peptidase inhibitor family I36 n=1 Tax=Streptomyces durmitorensis TaxID=319947 RepID=A0ABY4PK55_9ACTN|nr:hypothetical protein [Streptomyces durmitorensis]UQT53752.1 hypothetical protein M4V62_00925 [Streptomyces durmitorensis]